MTVIDNSSYDDTWEMLKNVSHTYPERINSYTTHLNKGYGTGCNIGARLTMPDYYVFLNSDIYVHKEHKDWLQQLVNTFQSEEDVGVAAPKLLNDDGMVNGHAVLGDNRDNNLEWYWLQEDGEEFNDLLDAVTLCGAALMIPRQLFWEMDGFDESYFHYYEEKDLIYTIRKEGYRAVCNPKSVLIHNHMGSCKNKGLLGIYEFMGRTHFLEKHKEFLEDPTRFER